MGAATMSYYIGCGYGKWVENRGHLCSQSTTARKYGNHLLVFLLHITLAECLKQIETYYFWYINDIDNFDAI